MLFDLSDISSYFAATRIIRKQLFKRKNTLFLIGNKYDAKKIDKISDDFIQKYNCKYFEISLKLNQGVDVLMENVGNYFANEEKIKK